MKDSLTRKEFLERIFIAGFGIAGAGSVLSSCGKTEEKAAETAPQKTQMPEQMADPCTDLTGLTQAEKEVRTTFEYVPHSTIPEKLCDNCQFWLVPEEGSPCGGCQIIKGPINPKGYCKQWVIKQT
jgi:hypothetical protein